MELFTDENVLFDYHWQPERVNVKKALIITCIALSALALLIMFIIALSWSDEPIQHMINYFDEGYQYGTIAFILFIGIAIFVATRKSIFIDKQTFSFDKQTFSFVITNKRVIIDDKFNIDLKDISEVYWHAINNKCIFKCFRRDLKVVYFITTSGSKYRVALEKLTEAEVQNILTDVFDR